MGLASYFLVHQVYATNDYRYQDDSTYKLQVGMVVTIIRVDLKGKLVIRSTSGLDTHTISFGLMTKRVVSHFDDNKHT